MSISSVEAAHALGALQSNRSEGETPVVPTGGDTKTALRLARTSLRETTGAWRQYAETRRSLQGEVKELANARANERVSEEVAAAITAATGAEFNPATAASALNDFKVQYIQTQVTAIQETQKTEAQLRATIEEARSRSEKQAAKEQAFPAAVDTAFNLVKAQLTPILGDRPIKKGNEEALAETIVKLVVEGNSQQLFNDKLPKDDGTVSELVKSVLERLKAKPPKVTTVVATEVPPVAVEASPVAAEAPDKPVA